MGVVISRMSSYFAYQPEGELEEYPGQVLALARKALDPLLQAYRPHRLAHLIVATTCPDSLTPSLGQRLNQAYSGLFGSCHVVDVVQGCAGGATALILGSQLAGLAGTEAVVVQADAARKATSRTSPLHAGFGNGSFACLLQPGAPAQGLLHYGSRQFPELTEVVTVSLGHDAHEIIRREGFPVQDPRRELGLELKPDLALRLLRQAEGFYLDFTREVGEPDVLILHQVSPPMIAVLKEVFGKYRPRFVDVAAQIGNCGAASVGIALDQVKHTVAGQKVMVCSFGTGGVITAGMWQF